MVTKLYDLWGTARGRAACRSGGLALSSYATLDDESICKFYEWRKWR